MDKELRRLGALIAVVDPGRRGLQRSSTTPVGVGRGARRRRRRPNRRRRTAPSPAEPTPALTAIPGTGSAAKPGDVEIRWYCCLGTGDAPEQVEVEEQVAEAFNASHPGIHLPFEGYPYAAARATRWRSSSAPAPARTSSARSASAAPRRSTASGSTSSRSSTRPATT